VKKKDANIFEFFRYKIYFGHAPPSSSQMVKVHISGQGLITGGVWSTAERTTP
jgi:hypothetical protein